MVTISDVARYAHVSNMTVSRVLNHPEQVSDDLKQRVLEAIKQLNYTPNRIGQALTKQQQLTMQFLILENIEKVDPYYAKLLLYLADYLQKKNYTLEIKHQLDPNLINQVDGGFINGARIEDIPKLLKLNFPLVSYGNISNQISSIDVDNFQGTYKMTKYLAKCNYENLIYLGLNLPEKFAVEREKGYLAAIKELNQKPIIYRLNNTQQACATLIQNITLPSNTALIAATDRLAIGALQQLELCGVDIPNEIGITGFDGVFMHQVTLKTLTTVIQPLDLVAKEMVDLLLEVITHKKVISRTISPKIGVGQTTRSCKQ